MHPIRLHTFDIGKKKKTSGQNVKVYLERDVLLGGLVELRRLEGDLQAGQLGRSRGGSGIAGSVVVVSSASAAAGRSLVLQLLGSLADLLLYLHLGGLASLGQTTAL